MAEPGYVSAMVDRRRRRLGLIAACCAAFLIGHARVVQAQTGGAYVSVSALDDVKRFSGDPATDMLSGHGVGASVAIGSSVADHWDVELGVDFPRFTEATQSSTVTVRRQIITLDAATKNRTLAVTALIRYRAIRRGRLQIGYLGGLSFLRLQRRFETQAPDGTPASLIPRPQELVDYGPAPVLGIDARIALGPRLSVVAAVQASAFAFREVSGVLVRPRIGVAWRF
jgi:hypothetical protein